MGMGEIFTAGVVRNSFVDWPGKIAFVIFLGGCNFTCPHCHNRDILGSTSNQLPYTEVLAEIREQIGFVDGVVISGGEPTVHPRLREIIAGIRALELPIKLDTNGSDFETLHALVTEELVDFVAMDIKAPLDRYVPLGFCKSQAAVENVRKSIAFLKTIGAKAMFRTTPIPELTESDFAGIKKLAGKTTWVKNHYVEAE